MPRTAAATPAFLTDRPTSLLSWREAEEGFVGGDYRIRLLGPYQWEISHRGRVLEINRSRRAAFEVVEDHFRARMRLRDSVRWAGVALGAAVVGGIAASWPNLHAAWLVGILSAAMFAGVSALVRMVAALTGNRNDPYRRREP